MASDGSAADDDGTVAGELLCPSDGRLDSFGHECERCVGVRIDPVRWDLVGDDHDRYIEVVLSVPAAGDMSENGARAQWAGTGLNLPRRYLTAGTLRLVVKRILEEPAFGRRAAELSTWAQRNNGPARAAALVEELAARGA